MLLVTVLAILMIYDTILSNPELGTFLPMKILVMEKKHRYFGRRPKIFVLAKVKS